jgi:hypothetical protein
MPTPTKTLKITAALHADLKQVAAVAPSEPINEMASRFIAHGVKAAKAKNARKAKKGAAS